MNKLIIIGNGFDLAHGLKTRYSDFLVWYLDQAILKHKENGIYSDKLLTIAGLWRSQARIKSLDDFIALTKAPYKPTINYDSGFLKDLIFNCSNAKWVDIEYDYYKRLVKYYLDDLNAQGEFWANTLQSVTNFHIFFDIIKEKLIEYLITIEVDNRILLIRYYTSSY